jgi:PTS system mannose-specific IID component
MYPKKIIYRCFLRTYCVNVAKTARNMQETGLLFLLEPALRWLYPEQKDFSCAVQRYLGPSNTHPFMIPLFSGILLSMEKTVAKGALPAESIGALRHTLATSLSALGDSFFGGTLLPAWALGCILLLFWGLTGWAAVLTASCCVLLFTFRLGSFVIGLKYGIRALDALQRWDLINWVERLKFLNAVLIAGLIIQLAMPHVSLSSRTVLPAVFLAIIAAVYLLYRRHLPRLLFFAAAVLIILWSGGQF